MANSVRRLTSWTSPEEFQLVFSSLFASQGDVRSQRFGIDRIKVWLSRGSCPHAVESTASLLEVLLRDESASSSPVASSSTTVLPRPSQYELRLSYSMALIRFVNSLVDPLQTTYYARSIATLAAQLGLPLWFVELRHAATHEDLPALPVLRDAVKQALDWLYTNYWLSALSPTTYAPLAPLEPLIASLTSYKALMKTSLRDASKTAQTKLELAKVYRGIDGWVAEAEAEGRGRERALEGLVEAFVMVGGLVPTAKRKRPSTRSPELSSELLAIWMPILERIDEMYEGFEDALLLRMIDLLSDVPDAEGGNTIDKSYAATLSAWVLYFVTSDSEPQMVDMVVKACLLSPSPSTLALLDSLSKADDRWAQNIKPLVSVLRNAESALSTPMKEDDALSAVDAMEARMKALENALARNAPAPSSNTSVSATTEDQVTGTKWRVVERWTPTPIGALPGGVVKLDLVV